MARKGVIGMKCGALNRHRVGSRQPSPHAPQSRLPPPSSLLVPSPYIESTLAMLLGFWALSGLRF
jgi:hypothetical protein